ncbi:MAG: ATP-dependent Clp protease adaptor ClpS [Saprospiraceae bacterium]|nr:ATP-dependent Clp protease adaptor ClpS [Saprospiraceae bacterium]
MWTDTDVLEEVDVLVEDAEETKEENKLIVHNDDHNTFDWVIECLVDICKHTFEQAEQCSYIIHFKGKYAVKHGALAKLRPMKDALTDRGLSVTIE